MNRKKKSKKTPVSHQSLINEEKRPEPASAAWNFLFSVSFYDVVLLKLQICPVRDMLNI